MIKVSLVLTVIILGIVIYYWLSSGHEGFFDKIETNMNKLSIKENPIDPNRAIPIGISEAEGKKLANIYKMALNKPRLVADGRGSFEQVSSEGFASDDQEIIPRIDDENSYLGLIKMCKEKGNSENPFSDPTFSENCGMCLTSGTLKTGESFTTPTGVLVYNEDKEIFVNEKNTEGYTFPKVIPSLRAATCVGASRSKDSLPVLAINAEDYDRFKKRIACKNSKTLGNECSRCVSNSEYSWVPTNGGKKPIALFVWGEGSVEVTLGATVILESTNLSMATPVSVNLGQVQEGTTIILRIIKGTSSNGPYVYGAIMSKTPTDTPYKLQIEKFLELDRSSGTLPRRGLAKYFKEVRTSCAKIMPQPTKDTMVLSGFIPLTFIESDQLATTDCPNSAFVSSQASAELLVSDPCLNPKGQGPGNYSEECVRSKLVSAGCSTYGSWYRQPLSIIGNKSISTFLTDLSNLIPKKETDPDVSLGCFAKDISTVCDPYLKGGIPDQLCLIYLYHNIYEKNQRLGNAYSSVSGDSMASKTLQGTTSFCSREGTLNPARNANAVTELQEKAEKGYDNVYGIEAVRRYLSHVFTKATGNLDANKSDAEGGRKDSWMKCFGPSIAPIPNFPQLVSKGIVPVDSWDAKTLSCIKAVETTGFIPKVTWGQTPDQDRNAECDDLLCPWFKHKYGSYDKVPSKYSQEIGYCKARFP
jgi:hypothetical protein